MSDRRTLGGHLSSGHLGGHFDEHGEKDHAQYASTQVRKYASRLRTYAILVATIAGLLLGSVPVSASTESEKVTVQPIPSKEDCVGVDDKWWKVVYRYLTQYDHEDQIEVDYTLDEFKTDMNSVITSPELINCGDPSIAYMAVAGGNVEIAKYAVSKGIDLTIRYLDSFLPDDWGYVTAYDYAVYCSRSSSIRTKYCGLDPDFTDAEMKAIFLDMANILKPPPPASATKPCVEVDGQTPPAYEYCIIGENVQSSRQIPVRGDFEKRFAGGSDYLYKADRAMSGTGLFPGWKAVITFTCSSTAESGCGYADYHFEDRWDPSYRKTFDRIYGLNVFCGESGDLLDLDRDLEPGESVSVVHASDTERSSPWYMHCRANALDPFTLTIKTTRLAK